MSMQKSGTRLEDEKDEESSRLLDERSTTIACVNKEYVPQVAFALIPQKTQTFRTLDEAKAFYVAYSKQAGFSVRERSDTKNRNKEVTWKLFVCYKEGTKNTRYQEKLKHAVERSGERVRADVRCQCLARMSVSWNKDQNLWRVSNFFEKHNHPLTSPSKVHALRGHRDVSPAVRSRAVELRDANLKTADLRRVPEEDIGGPDKIGCLEKDLYNNASKLTNVVTAHDLETLLDHFQTEKATDGNFYFSYETSDSGNVLDRCYWSDVHARNSYRCFPDVVVFDSTKNTNKYDMFFCPFVGVNNHDQTTIFGCGLLSNQSTESFIWLFNQFLNSMPGNIHPRLIITDQDEAITAAIHEVFPNTVQRFCIWHILAKFPENINVAMHGDDKSKLVYAIMDSDDPQEFESHWSKLMSTTSLSQNRWINEMYIIRDMWIPAYLKNIFSAGMSSLQQAESKHSFFKTYLNSDCSLNDVYTRSKNAIVRQRHKELLLDHEDKNEKQSLNSSQPMERQLSTRYTRTIFKKFQKQLKALPEYVSSPKGGTSVTRVHEVFPFSGSKLKDKTRWVTHNLSTNFISCSCRKFEHVGIPCRHILYMMQMMQIKLLPEEYIVSRWTQEARSELTFQPMPSLLTRCPGFLERSRGLSEKWRWLIEKAATSEESTSVLHQIFEDAGIIIRDNEVVGNTQETYSPNERRDEPSTYDPVTTHVVRAQKRLLSMRERAIISGGKHWRTCPDFKDRSANEVYQPSLLSNTTIADDSQQSVDSDMADSSVEKLSMDDFIEHVSVI